MIRMAIAVALTVLFGCSGEPPAATGGAEEIIETIERPSGLVLHRLVAGSGASPAATDTVEVHYHGTFENGDVFDSSVERGQPSRFPLNRVIACWTEGLQLMKAGGKAKLVCPPDIAYGANGRPGRIPPNSTLHFEVQLIDVL